MLLIGHLLPPTLFRLVIHIEAELHLILSLHSRRTHCNRRPSYLEQPGVADLLVVLGKLIEPADLMGVHEVVSLTVKNC